MLHPQRDQEGSGDELPDWHARHMAVPVTVVTVVCLRTVSELSRTERCS
jgi:hypothetical protein